MTTQLVSSKQVQNGNETGILVEFLVTSKPKSYSAPYKQSKYPVFFMVLEPEKGVDSRFRWRSGSFARPKIGKGKIGQRSNLRQRIQLQFFFELEWVVWGKGMLLGPVWARRPPKKTNPKKLIYFDKHSLACYRKLSKHLQKLGS